MKTKLHIDIETYSSSDLGKTGVYRYVEAPDFEVLLFAYAFENEEVNIIDLAQGEKIPKNILEALFDESIQKWAHNANFERTCLDSILEEKLDVCQWHCSAVKSGYSGLPISLRQVSEALNLGDKGKLSAGKALIRYFCGPCKPTKVNGGRIRNLPHHDPEKWEQFKEYCRQDVVAERIVEEILQPIELPVFERVNYIIDQEINDRGVLIDKNMVRNANLINDRYTDEIKQKIKDITGVENPNSGQQLKGWLKEATGKNITSLAKDKIPEILENTDSAAVRKVLKYKSKLSKTSVKKYAAMENCVCLDERAHGLFQFYGASRTGRWAGRLRATPKPPAKQNERP